MKNAKILLIALIFGITAGKNTSAADLTLVGTWKTVYYDAEYTMILGESDFEFPYESKGTYAVNGDIITFTPTHFWDEFDDETSGWITKAALLENYPAWAEWLEPLTAFYSSSGGTLTIIWEDGSLEIFIKQ